MIDPLELKLYRSAVVSDGSTNGGRMGYTEVIDGAAANLFRRTSQAERTAGAIKYRKAFWKVANDADLALAAPQMFLDRYTLGPDIISFFPGTQVDTQATITGSEDQYGAGKLNASVLAGVTVIAVLVEAAATILYRDGETIRVSDKVTADAVGGNEEFVVIDGTPSIVGNVVTITFAPALQNGYSAADTYVASVYEPADIVGSVSGFLVTTAGDGAYNSASLTVDSIGGEEHTVTHTWTSATAFTATSDIYGSLGTGSIAAGISPNNPAFSKPFYALAPGGFSGTWASGDTLVATFHPASVGFWYKRNVPAGSVIYPSNTAVTTLAGETS